MSTEEPKIVNGDDPVHSALEHLHEAEHELERVHELEHKAEVELRTAEKELREAQCEQHDTVEVHVKHINEVKSVDFKVPRQATLQAVWDQAYVKLEIPKRDTDIFQTAGEKPKSLMSFLGMTVDEAKEEGVISNYRFEIASETGGA